MLETSPTPDQMRRARKRLRRSQATIAKMLGVSYATYSRWENGKSAPQPDRREKLWRLINLAEKQEV